MATRIQGITIELGADTSGLQKALKDVNSTLSSTQKELRQVDKALKMDPSNTALIEQKMRLLGQAVDQTTQKLNALKAAQAKVAEGMASGKNTQSQFDALTREISTTQSKLTSLTQEQNNFKNATTGLAGALGSGTSGLASFGNAAQSVASATAAISAAAAAALAGIMALTVSAASTADDWETLSQQIGLSTESIQKFQYASDLIDVDMTDIISSVRTMKGHLDDTSGVWDRLGVKIKTQSGQYRDIEAIFYDTVKALGAIENETERDTVAMSIFGKKADELAGLLDDGGKKFKELGQQAQNVGAIVSDEDLQALNELNDLLATMKAQLKGGFMQAAASAAQALAPAFRVIAVAVEAVAKKLSELNPITVAYIGVILAVIAVISPIAGVIANISFAIIGLTQVLPILAGAIEVVNAAAMTTLGNPVVVTVVAITAALVALGIAIYEVVKHWDEIKAATSSAISTMQNAFNNIVSSAKNIGSSIKDSIGNAVNGIIEKFLAIGEGVKSGLSKIPDAFHAIEGRLSQFVEAVKSVGTEISSFFNDLAGKAREAGVKVITGFADGVSSVISKVIETVQKLIDKMKSLWDSAANDAKAAGQKTGSNFASGYNQGSSAMQSNNGGMGGFGGMTMNVNVSQIGQLSDLLRISNQAQQFSRMGAF